MVDTLVYRHAYVTVLDWWEQFWPWVYGLCRLLPRYCYKEIVKVLSYIYVYGWASITACVTSHWSHVLGVHFIASRKSTLCTAITRQHTAESIINWHAQDTTTLQTYLLLPGMSRSLVRNIKWSDFVQCHHHCQGQAHFVSQMQYIQTLELYTHVTGTSSDWHMGFMAEELWIDSRKGREIYLLSSASEHALGPI